MKGMDDKKDLTSERFCGLLCVGGDPDVTTNEPSADAAGADLKSREKNNATAPASDHSLAGAVLYSVEVMR